MPMITPAQERTIIIGRLGLGKGTLRFCMRMILLHGKVNVFESYQRRASNCNREHSNLARPPWVAALVTS